MMMKQTAETQTSGTINGRTRYLSFSGAGRQARPLAERALAIHERALGRDHPLVATALLNVAALLQDQATCELICDLIGLGLSVLLAAFSIMSTLRSAKAGTLIVKDYIILEWWVQWPLGLMLVLLAIEFVFRIHRLVTGPIRARTEGGSV